MHKPPHCLSAQKHFSTLVTLAHKGWGYSRPLRHPGGGIKPVGVPQPKPLHGFSPNFQGMFTPRGSRAD